MMERFFKYKLDHLIFWGLTITFHSFTRIGLTGKAGLLQFVLEILIRNGLLATVIYTNLLLIIPRFANRKNTGWNIILIILTLLGYAFAKNAHDVYLYGTVLGDAQRQAFFYNTFYNLSIVTFYLAFAVTLYLSKEWYLQRQLIRKIEIEKLNTELEYLKAQINPHFLFNSINTIYFQIDKGNKDARESLSKFSDMLRYQLYECNGKEIAVEKEINYLKNYVELQRLRKDEHYDIQFTHSNDLKDFTLPPLLLIPFVENAFKHVSHFNDKQNKIEIELSKSGNLFRLNVLNTKDTTRNLPAENGGIGLKNVKRRLELLYKDRHLLDISESPENFMVNLELHLTLNPSPVDRGLKE